MSDFTAAQTPSSQTIFRIAQELSSLAAPASLPCSLSSCILVRSDDTKIPLIKAVITGWEENSSKFYLTSQLTLSELLLGPRRPRTLEAYSSLTSTSPMATPSVRQRSSLGQRGRARWGSTQTCTMRGRWVSFSLNFVVNSCSIKTYTTYQKSHLMLPDNVTNIVWEDFLRIVIGTANSLDRKTARIFALNMRHIDQFKTGVFSVTHKKQWITDFDRKSNTDQTLLFCTEYWLWDEVRHSIVYSDNIFWIVQERLGKEINGLNNFEYIGRTLNKSLTSALYNLIMRLVIHTW